GTIAMAAVFPALLLALELPVQALIVSAGRRLEARFRRELLEKIPQINDRYFSSRLSSDMAERAHSIHEIQTLPTIVEATLRNALELVLTTAGLLWLWPEAWKLIGAFGLTSLLVPAL